MNSVCIISCWPESKNVVRTLSIGPGPSLMNISGSVHEICKGLHEVKTEVHIVLSKIDENRCKQTVAS